MSEITYNDAKDFLLKNDGGNNLYDHITRVLAKIVVDAPEDSFDAFESISRYMKDSVIKSKSDRKITAVKDKALATKIEKWVESTIKLTDEPKDESEQIMTITGLQDWLSDSRLFEWAGVGFPAQENYAVYCSLRKLAATTENIKNLRLFGKIFGQQNDYLVAEGEIEGSDEGSEGFEPRGTGVNKFVYWVATDASGPWFMLPDAAPAEIVAARKLKRVLTGDLDAPVITYPPFPGAAERNYVRALIAIIASETVLCPAGTYITPEDEESEHIVEKQLDPEWLKDSFPGSEELKDFGGWTHWRSGILKTGRTTYPQVDAEEEPELAEQIDAQRDEDPEQGALRGLDTDPPVSPPGEDEDTPGPEGAWSITTAGDKCTYNIDSAEISYGVTVVSSLRWPGALNVVQGKNFAHIYVGYGLQAGLPPFSPAAPADVQEEPLEKAEEPEPTPLEEEVNSDGGDADDDAPEEDEEEA